MVLPRSRGECGVSVQMFTWGWKLSGMVGPRNGVEHPRVSQQSAGRMRHRRKPWQVISLVPRVANYSTCNQVLWRWSPRLYQQTVLYCAIISCTVKIISSGKEWGGSKWNMYVRVIQWRNFSKRWVALWVHWEYVYAIYVLQVAFCYVVDIVLFCYSSDLCFVL